MRRDPVLYRLADTRGDDRAVCLAVADDTGRVVGTARLEPGDVWQLTSLAVASPADGSVGAALCHGVVQTLRINRARHWAAPLDQDGRELLAGFGLLPVTSSVSGLLDRQRRMNPEGFQLVTQGYGLGDVELPYPAELLTDPDVGRRLVPAG